MNSPERGGVQGKRGYITASICTFLIVSCALVTYTAFFSNRYPWVSNSCELKLVSPSLLSSIRITHLPESTQQDQTGVSHIVFGIGGAAETWDQRRQYTELWWRKNVTRGYVWLDKEPIGSWPETCPSYKISPDTSRYGKRASASRIAQIAVESYRLVSSEPNRTDTRWFVMGDDDTVFFVENLVNVLGKYDHEQMYYVGMSSESVEQDVLHGYGMAFGGGGFAISYPAAESLSALMDGCLNRYSNFYGSDKRVQSCLAELGIPLTREPGFHQMDLHGDLYGYLAAHPLSPLVSLHHLDYVDNIIPNRRSQLDSLRTIISAYRFDPARTLQQTFGYESGSDFTWSVSVSWGYTVQIYPWSLPPSELATPFRTFTTWRSSSNGPFIFNTRELNRNDACNLPMVFFLDRVENQTGRVGNGEVSLSEYMKHDIYTGSKQNNKCSKRRGFYAASLISRVRVFAPKMDPLLWRKAPRRHCCVTRRTGIYGTTLEVRIKYCGPAEVASQP